MKIVAKAIKGTILVIIILLCMSIFRYYSICYEVENMSELENSIFLFNE